MTTVSFYDYSKKVSIDTDDKEIPSLIFEDRLTCIVNVLEIFGDLSNVSDENLMDVICYANTLAGTALAEQKRREAANGIQSTES